MCGISSFSKLRSQAFKFLSSFFLPFCIIYSRKRRGRPGEMWHSYAPPLFGSCLHPCLPSLTSICVPLPSLTSICVPYHPLTASVSPYHPLPASVSLTSICVPSSHTNILTCVPLPVIVLTNDIKKSMFQTLLS